ncbi:MAG: Uma2 family endonuclease [Spirochaetales bacterium]|nr:Uma2 family endonuclease [Spirochaetales bacterium]
MADYIPGTSLKKNEKYTYEDYLLWPNDQRWELIGGYAYLMSPAPTTSHQRLSRVLSIAVYNYIEGKNCEAFCAPFDVKLAEDTVVQPDLLVICDKSKIEERGCSGAPDLVVEILSDSTAYKDETEKRLLYERSGVREYWIINPGLPEVVSFVRGTAGFLKPEHLSRGETLKSEVLGGFELPLKKLFSVLD